MKIRDILKEFAPGGSSGNGPFDYGAAIIMIGETFVDHYQDSAAGVDAAMIIAVGETFMNRGMMPGIKALFELDTQVYDHVLDELANEGFNVEQDIIAQRRKIPRDPKAGQLFAKARADWQAQAGDVYQVTGRWGTGSSVGQDIKARSEEEARQKFLASNPEYKFKSVDVKRRGGAAGIAEGKFDPRTGGQTPRDYSPDSDDFKTPQEYEQAAFRENPWQAVVVDRPGFLDFEVQLTNPLTQQQLNFIMRPVDMITSFGGGEITPDTFDVRDLQTGKTTQWDSGWGMPMHHTAAWFLFADDPYLQKELQKILAYYEKLGDEGENVPEMPGLVGGHQPAGQSFSSQDVIDSGATDLKAVPSAIAANKAAAAIAKAKAKKPDQDMAEGTMDDVELYGLRIGDTVKVRLKGQEAQGDIIDIFPNTQEVELLLRGALAGRTVTVDVRRTESLDEQIDIGSEWMSDTELDQYVPDQLEQEWRELVGYDMEGRPHPLWANMTGGYEPDVNDPQDRANMVKVANKWFAMKRIPGVRFLDVRDADDELEWLVQIGKQDVAEKAQLGSGLGTRRDRGKILRKWSQSRSGRPLGEQDMTNEFAPGGSGSGRGGRKIPRNPGSDPWGDDGDDDDREPPYKYPKPRHYAQSVDFFSQFEADHFDREDFDDATGVFKGYWGDTQIASFKFTDPNQTGPDDPGMGWYYEPDPSGGDGKVSRPAASVDNDARREEQKRQELSIIDMFLKSGQTPKPGSQIYALMQRHGMLED